MSRSCKELQVSLMLPKVTILERETFMLCVCKYMSMYVFLPLCMCLSCIFLSLFDYILQLCTSVHHKNGHVIGIGAWVSES